MTDEPFSIELHDGRPTYQPINLFGSWNFHVCAECGAMVTNDMIDHHNAFHDRLNEMWK